MSPPINSSAPSPAFPCAFTYWVNLVSTQIGPMDPSKLKNTMMAMDPSRLRTTMDPSRLMTSVQGSKFMKDMKEVGTKLDFLKIGRDSPQLPAHDTPPELQLTRVSPIFPAATAAILMPCSCFFHNVGFLGRGGNSLFLIEEFQKSFFSLFFFVFSFCRRALLH